MDKYIVSTVFLVYDHAFDGPPVLFETMIMHIDQVSDEYLYRYHTWDEAVIGHNLVVNRMSKKYPKIEPVWNKDKRSDTLTDAGEVRFIRVDNK